MEYPTDPRSLKPYSTTPTKCIDDYGSTTGAEYYLRNILQVFLCGVYSVAQCISPHDLYSSLSGHFLADLLSRDKRLSSAIAR